MARKAPRQRLSREERKDARRKKTVSIILAVIMVASLAGIFIGSTVGNNTTKFTYGDYDFELIVDYNQGVQYFQTEINNQEFQFYTLPQDALRIKTLGNLSEVIGSAQLFTLSTEYIPEYEPIFEETRFIIDVYTPKRIQKAYVGDSPDPTVPVLSCANATRNTPVIEVLATNETSEIITTDYGCAQIAIRQNDLALLRDRLIYTALGVI